MFSLSLTEKPAQVLVAIAVLILVTVGLYFAMYQRLGEQNRLQHEKLQARLVEINSLRRYEKNLPALDQQIGDLKQQLEIQKHIVPDEEEADQFMHLLQYTAQSAGIKIRRWTAKPISTKEFYTEVPFDLELDGSYYSLLDFFERVARLERIINISNLQLTSIHGQSKLGHGYQYGPRETVVGTCTATTFFSHEPQAAGPKAKAGVPLPAQTK